VLGEMDLAAAIAARRFSHNKVVTVAVDKVIFKNPVHTGDTLSCYTTVVRVGRTSVAVKVDARVKRMGRVGEDDVYQHGEEEVTCGLFTMVAVDKEGKPKPIAPA
jgi:acyl-CoA thioesterase YciA